VVVDDECGVPMDPNRGVVVVVWSVKAFFIGPVVGVLCLFYLNRGNDRSSTSPSERRLVALLQGMDIFKCEYVDSLGETVGIEYTYTSHF
jgi:hypothetical protein